MRRKCRVPGCGLATGFVVAMVLAAPVAAGIGDAGHSPAMSAVNAPAGVIEAQAQPPATGEAMTGTDAPLDASPEALAQRQLSAYNARDVEAFLEPYSDDVEVYDYPGKLLYTGKARMRERYTGLFAASPDLHCALLGRMVLGNVVIDHEHLSGHRDGVTKAMAIYTVRDGRIVRVEFVK